MKKSIKALLILAVVLMLCGCAKSPVIQEETVPPTVIEQIAMVVTEESIAELEQNYPGLKEADLRGSTCYDALESYIVRHPEVAVTYTVDLGGKAVQPETQNLELNAADFTFPTLRQNLKYLRQLQSVYLSSCTLMPDAIHELQAAYPNVDIRYSIDFCGQTVESTAQELNLTNTAPADALARAPLLTQLPDLQDIWLMKEDGSTDFTLEDVAALQELVPNALLHYTFTLFGKTVTTSDEEIIYKNQSIGNQAGAVDTLRQALTVLRGCNRFVLDNCKFDNETMAALRDEFRDTTKIVWRVWFGDGGVLTDREVLRHVYGLYDYNCSNLLYCEGAEFADFGHNEYLKNCDFVSGMPNLKAIILSGSMISDLSPFAHCENLEFLELAYCGYVTDISPLAYCTNLKRLNIAFTKVDDLSALDELNLEVMVDARSKTSAEERARFDSLHPDCLIQHTGDAKDDQPYNYPWRYEKNGDANEYYALLKEKFNYPNTYNTLY